MEVLPPVGNDGRRPSTREHGSLHGEQLLYPWVLEELAPKLQPLDHTVGSLRTSLTSAISNPGLRYIYIPLGGAKNTVVNTLLVFTFVALWHDLSFRLLAWGWLVSLFVIPELLASYLVPKSKVRTYQSFFCTLWWSHELFFEPFSSGVPPS